MAVLGLSHVAVGAGDMERALLFYRDPIGLRVTPDAGESGFGRGSPEQNRRRAVYLRTDDGPRAFFVAPDQPLDPEPSGPSPRLPQPGTHHFAFRVDDLRARHERIAAAHGEPAGSDRVPTTMVGNPDGNPVQLDQRL